MQSRVFIEVAKKEALVPTTVPPGVPSDASPERSLCSSFSPQTKYITNAGDDENMVLGSVKQRGCCAVPNFVLAAEAV